MKVTIYRDARVYVACDTRTVNFISTDFSDANFAMVQLQQRKISTTRSTNDARDE